MFKQLIVLLDGEVMPVSSWFGIVLAGMVALLGFLLRDAYKTVKESQVTLSNKITELEVKEEKEVKELDKRINDLHINILNRLDDIKDKFNEFRK